MIQLKQHQTKIQIILNDLVKLYLLSINQLHEVQVSLNLELLETDAKESIHIAFEMYLIHAYKI